MGVKIRGDNLKKKLKGIIKRANNLKEPMKTISVDMKNEIQRNIDEEHSYDGKPWKKSKRAKEQNGETLKDTGRLYKSFRYSSGSNFARVGTNVKYASTMNYGAKKGSLWKGTYTVKAHYRRVKYKTKKGQWAKNRKRIRVKSHTRRGQAPWGDIPERRFMGISTEQKQNYLEILTDYIIKGR